MPLLEYEAFVAECSRLMRLHRASGSVWFTVKKLSSAASTAATDDSRARHARRKAIRDHAVAKRVESTGVDAEPTAASADPTAPPPATAAAARPGPLAVDGPIPPGVPTAVASTQPTSLLVRVTDGSKRKSSSLSCVVTPAQLHSFSGAFCHMLRQNCDGLRRPAAAPKAKPPRTTVAAPVATAAASRRQKE
eukprot:TRINITY_DN27923_c0_g1_i1.p1 TRINITY_DN27923_c0_g1~~TRINITY_DN27923_c0_g1_i1.p1  ORF type:complete len:192 (-),score=18.72 TRINITY_DN27923_c0_g1_i1:153-728(-)